METPQERLKELLAARRAQIPGDDYFKGVLPEFHRRLRVESLRQTSLIELLWERFQAVGVDFSVGWRYLAATSVAVVACFITFYPSNSGTGLHLMKLDNFASEKQRVEYSLAEAGDMSLTSKIDQQLDRVSLSGDKVLPTNLMAMEAPAHYVLTNHPVTYDTQVAF